MKMIEVFDKYSHVSKLKLNLHHGVWDLCMLLFADKALVKGIISLYILRSSCEVDVQPLVKKLRSKTYEAMSTYELVSPR